MNKINFIKSNKIVFVVLVYGYFSLLFFLDLRISVMFFVMVFYGYVHLFHPKLAPDFFKKILLGLVVGFLFFVYFPSFISLDVFVAFLSLMLALKTLELEKKRDLYILLFLSSFLPVATALYDQSLWVFIYILGYVFLFLGVLYFITNEHISNWRVFLAEGGSIFLYSMPLVLLLFFLFPRLPHAFLGFSKKHVGISGLSQEIEPGVISQLVLSDKVAFRVKFDTIPFNIDQLYFRCGAYEALKYGGAKIVEVRINKFPLKVITKPSYYRIFLEPGSRFVPFLEMTNEMPKLPGISLYEGLFYLTNKQITSPIGYKLNHISTYVLGASTPMEKKRCLDVEPFENPRTQELVKALRKRSSSVRELISSLSRVFSRGFFYTLDPPTWPKHNPIDYFLFVTKRGFCEHYAVALTYMLRYAKIPARVVSGYKGGELNPIGNYLIVKQSYAHAWVEAYVDDLVGWIRIDPIDFIPRENMDKSIEEIEKGIIRDYRVPSVLREIISIWDFVNYKYRIWIVDYSYNRQISLFKKLGFDITRSWYIVGCLIGVVILIVLTCIFFVFSRPKKDSVHDYFLIFLEKLDKKGLKVDTTYGPVEITCLLRSKNETWVDKALLVIELYIKIRYENKYMEEDVIQYMNLIKDF